MHIDARKLENGSIIEGDICIIGAGAAGISLAMDWINTPYKVILLEGGGFEYDEQIQELYNGKTTGQRYYPLKSSRLHYFGGTTGHWAGYCSTFDEIDFKKRDWVPASGWPIHRADLDPYYEKAHRYLDLGPYDYSLEYWKTVYPKYSPLVQSREIIWDKMWQFSPPSRFGEKYREPIVNARNIHLYTYANVTDIRANEGVNSIMEVKVKNHAGREHSVKARHFVLACCSIQNARLLLSANKQAPRGLGNDHDLVGRYFMEHLEIDCGELWLAKNDPLPLYDIDYGVTKARAEIAVSEAMQTKHRILNGTLSLLPLSWAKNFKPMIDVWDNPDPRESEKKLFGSFKEAGEKSRKEVDAKTFGSYKLFMRIEQAPNPDSRVTLDTETDALGMPRGKLNWVLTPLEKRSIRKICELVGQAVGAEGRGRVRLMEYLRDEKDESWPAFTGGGWHHIGTTRMSDSPQTGVVDSQCKVHGIDNLYCAGSSCYATAAAPNPTLTLVALTLRLSDHLKKVAGK